MPPCTVLYFIMIRQKSYIEKYFKLFPRVLEIIHRFEHLA